MNYLNIPTVIMCLFLQLSVAVLSGIHSSSIQAEPLRVGFGSSRPPYVIEDQGRGIEIDLVRKVLKSLGHEIDPVYLSNNDLHLAVDAYNLDVTTSVRLQYDFKHLYYSDPYIQYRNVAISRAASNYEINQVADLNGRRVGAWQLARGDLGDEFKTLADDLGSRYFEYKNQQLQNLAFWQGKIDVLIIDRSIFLWMRHQLSDLVDTSDKVVVHELFPPRTEFRVAFRNEQLRDQFNQQLKIIKANGEYQRIVERYAPDF